MNSLSPARLQPSSRWQKAVEVGLGSLAGHLVGGPFGGAVAALGGDMAARNLMRSMTHPQASAEYHGSRFWRWKHGRTDWHPNTGQDPRALARGKAGGQ